MKIVFYGTREYDHYYFDVLAADPEYGCEIRFLTANLDADTAPLARGGDAVCAFVNADCSASVLERLANAGYIRKGNILLDYGCGKGRVDFFLSYQTRCKSIGIEYDERIYEKAAENKKDAVSSGRVEIELANAEEFAVPETADCMYFFNPFSVEILRKVMARILESYYAEPRRIQLFFYYPSDEYISYLMTVEELMFIDEIVCMDLFPGEDPREKIAIFELDYME